MSSQPTAKFNKDNAFLIVDGNKVFAINNENFSIGRKKDNDIIIDNPHASRYHAKIRFINQKYVLFDLKSTVGTSVNGNKTDAVILQSGDVISIGGVPLIFGIGSPDTAMDASQPTNTSTGPTDSTDVDELDNYIDMFRDRK